MPLKILHTADVHLGLSFRNHPEARETLANARYETLQTIVDRANELEANILVIAGDLFEKTGVKTSEIMRAIGSINQFEGNVALILPGNHDYISADSQLWNRMKQEAKDNVIILDKKEPLYLSDYDLDVVVYPGPCHSKHSEENTIGWVKELKKDDKFIHIGIAHGSMEGVSPDFDKKYYPMTMNELRDSGVNIWLTGHTHITWPDKPGSRDIVFNPGTPEPDGFDCPHEGKVYLHTLDEQKKINTEIISTGSCRFLNLSENINSEKDVEELIQKYTGGKWNRTVLSLRVKGQLETEDYELWQSKKNTIREGVLELQLDDSNVRMKVTPEVIRKEFVEGSFPEKLLSSFSEEETMELQMAYELLKEVEK